MRETLESIFIGLYLGLMMAGFVLSIIEVRLILSSKDNYSLVFFYVIAMFMTLSILVYFLKEGLSNISLMIGVLTALSLITGELIIMLELAPKS